MTFSRKYSLPALALLLVAGCKAEPAPPSASVNPPVIPPDRPQDPPGDEETTFDDHWTPVSPDDRGPGDLLPVAEADGKYTRRLSVAQLQASIPALFDGLTWTNGNRNNPQNMFDLLSRTLGEADYVQVTQENIDPTPLFHKFMDDMAGQVCTNAVTRDASRSDLGTRTVMPYPDDVDRNLRWLRLKLHAIHVPDGSSEGVAELRQLYDAILADTGNANQAWTGVCIAMLTAPEFMAY